MPQEGCGVVAFRSKARGTVVEDYVGMVDASFCPLKGELRARVNEVTLKLNPTTTPTVCIGEVEVSPSRVSLCTLGRAEVLLVVRDSSGRGEERALVAEDVKAEACLDSCSYRVSKRVTTHTLLSRFSYSLRNLGACCGLNPLHLGVCASSLAPSAVETEAHNNMTRRSMSSFVAVPSA